MLHMIIFTVSIIANKALTMHPISVGRFNALAAYCRFGPAMWLIEECEWHESEDGKMLGLVQRDLQDGDYQGAILASKLKEKVLRGAQAGARAPHPSLNLDQAQSNLLDYLERFHNPRMRRRVARRDREFKILIKPSVETG